jgi:hypothetical protein
LLQQENRDRRRHSRQRRSVSTPLVGNTHATDTLLLSLRSRGRWLPAMQAAELTDLRSTRGVQASVGAGADNPRIRCGRLEGPAQERADRGRAMRYCIAQHGEAACSVWSQTGSCRSLVPRRGGGVSASACSEKLMPSAVQHTLCSAYGGDTTWVKGRRALLSAGAVAGLLRARCVRAQAGDE